MTPDEIKELRAQLAYLDKPERWTEIDKCPKCHNDDTTLIDAWYGGGRLCRVCCYAYTVKGSKDD